MKSLEEEAQPTEAAPAAPGRLSATPPAARWVPPASFDEYSLIEPLGRGEMGEVFLAYDRMLARYVAVKFIAMREPDAGARERLLVEARAAARLQHPNVVAVFRVGDLEGHPYLVSEFVKGETLERMAKPMPASRALGRGLDLARGLAAAHRRGVLHRDIKSANAIVAEDGTAKLLDFGLAKLTDERREARSTGQFARPLLPRVLPDERKTRAAAATLPPTDEPVAAADGPLPFARRHQTRQGTLVGTPDYLAPEIWRGEPHTRRSDVYALGAILYELVAGRTPFQHVPEDGLEQVVESEEVPPLAVVVPGIDPRFAALVERCVRREAAMRFASGDEVREALEEMARISSELAVPEGNPYRGLRAFEAEHRSLFYGRSTESGIVLDRLRSESLVIVTGESGLGKSSLCRAGVLPVVESALGGGRRWSVLSLVPGRHPVSSLARAFAAHFQVEELAMARRLRSDPGAALLEVHRRQGADAGVLIFVDQLEELLTLTEAEDVAVVDELFHRIGAGVPGFKLLATVRADLVGRLARLRYLGDELSRSLYFLRPLSADRLRDVIVEPAHATGVRFESEELIEVLASTAASAHGGLPLLQFTLAELWEARDRDRNLITAAGLESLGGVAGALARHADAVLAGLLATQRLAARRLLTRLVTLEWTRVRRTELELTGGDPVARAALDALVHARLVIAHEADGTGAYELAHEVLLQGWRTLCDWLLEDADRRALRERLTAAAGEWERLGRGAEALWAKQQLEEAADLRADELTPREAEFLRLSRGRLRRKVWSRNGLVVGIVALVAAVYAFFELSARGRVAAQVRARVGAAERELAEGRRVRDEAAALRSRSFLLFDARQREPAERIWSEAVARGDRVAGYYARATQALEGALVLDPARTELRALFAETLFERADLAWRDRQREQVDELVQRLALYDTGGGFMERWKAPGIVSIESLPPGAVVTMERLDASGSAPKDLGTAPLADVRVDPGSYRLTLRAPGHAVVRYPVLIDRGDRLQLVVDLPRAERVPQAFVYVPPGRFLFGSAAEERLRRTYHDTAPLHEVLTAGYLIGRYEVTFGDWIEYLRALPPAARKERAPSLPRTAFSGELTLTELADGRWELAFNPAGRLYRVRSGEKIRYPTRKRRAEQDWLRLPVTGISAGDATAYAAWLAATGRVPGARLCKEYEWERAARGADDREFPHGNRLEVDDANHDETYNKDPGAMGPDEVGAHPASRSPFGLHDMAGNAFEWVVSSLASKGYAARGGSYMHDASATQVANRNTPVTTYRDTSVGMRVCATFP